MKTIRCSRMLLWSAALVLLTARSEAAQAPLTWKAGAATADITPDGPVWMSGYGSRKKPSESVAQRISAKALAIEDSLNSRVVIVTLDLSTVPRWLRDAVERQVGERYTLPPGSLLLNASHTHSGPSLSGAAVINMGGVQADPEILKKADAYGKMVEGKIVQTIGEAYELIRAINH